ncbi:hypothetical protein L6452_05049 [Arctium lappa]|uniref:Uncharacterized protein n=1 Tax=Arctium lappa TaxID=4217 RepID=A0ACB9EEW5_ARCLA|nr:hypothetical protein L6452_05049 [Arctium lappa]
MAMAIHPPTKTLTEDLSGGARPNAAPNHPKTANTTVIVATITPILNKYDFMNEAANRGTIEPSEKARVDATVACKGFGKLSFSSLDLLSLFIWDNSISSCEKTETNSPIAMLQVAATKTRKPIKIMALMSCLMAPMPIIREAVDTKPS